MRPVRRSDWWTIGGGIMVVNNIINHNHPFRQTSNVARRHRVATVCLLAAYTYHFLYDPNKELNQKCTLDSEL